VFVHSQLDEAPPGFDGVNGVEKDSIFLSGTGKQVQLLISRFSVANSFVSVNNLIILV